MRWVLFFDGECGFCNKSVQLVYRLDGKGEIDFAPLQGEFSKELGLEKYADKDGGSMVMLREEDGEQFFKGDAWIALGEALGGFWNLLARVFAIFPKGVRDWSYDLFAKNRYLLVGNGDACGIPEEGLRARMRE